MSLRWNHRRKTIMDDTGQSCKAISPCVDKPQQVGVTILELRLFSCRYIIGSDDNVGAIFCGVTVIKPPYCTDHRALCYLAPPKPLKVSDLR